MQKLDTHTVLEIIKMIDTQKAFIQTKYEIELEHWENPCFSSEEYKGRIASLKIGRAHV